MKKLKKGRALYHATPGRIVGWKFCRIYGYRRYLFRADSGAEWECDDWELTQTVDKLMKGE